MCSADEGFFQMFLMFHLCPPNALGEVVTSRAQKIKNVTVYLDCKVHEHITPSSQVAIGESIVGFKGQTVFKMCNPNKPTNWGL
jgi:hypothetical protein